MPEDRILTEILARLDIYCRRHEPREMEAARALILVLAIQRDYKPADVQAITEMINGALPV